jgi:hypothetical protein
MEAQPSSIALKGTRGMKSEEGSPMLKLRIILALLIVAAPCYAKDAKEPRMIFKSKVIDLGAMTQGETKKAFFEFNNAGNVDLVIARTRSSCGCATAFSTRKMVPPDSGGTVEVTFNSTQFRGAKVKHVYVYSNDPQVPVDTLTIKAFVKSEIDCTPRNILFSNAKKGERLSAKVFLYNPGEKPVTVISLLPHESFIKVKWDRPRALNPNDTVAVFVEVTPPDTSSTFGGSIGVRIDRKTPVPFSIRVFGTFKK